LSDIKAEVESIIKTGRKMVQENLPADPVTLSSKLDSLKELYNKVLQNCFTLPENLLFQGWALTSHYVALKGQDIVVSHPRGSVLCC
jgi:hypothetical protein